MASIVLARGISAVLFPSVGFLPTAVTRNEVSDTEVSAENFAGLVFIDPETESWDVSVFDRAVLRGDGFFEAISVIDGKIPVSLDLHLERLATSAAALDMPRPDVEAFKTACMEMIARYNGEHDESVYGHPAHGTAYGHDDLVHTDSMLRIVVSRGLDFGTGMGKKLGAGIPSVWMYLDGEGDTHSTDPVTMVSLTAGYDSTSSALAPWLLRGAKTLSYAVNMAAEREARRRGMTDALFITTDKCVLESPYASVVARFGNTLVTPDPAIGVLHGTTQQELFAYGRRVGLSTQYRDVSVAELKQADAAYQTRGGWVIPVSKLDTVDFAVDTEFVAAANHALHYEREAQEEELLNDDYGI